VQLAIVVLEQLGLLKDSDREPTGLAPRDDGRVDGGCGAGGAPGGNDADLGVGEWLARVDVQVDGAQQRGEGIAVGGALLIDDRSGGEQDTQRRPWSGLAGTGEVS